ALISALLSVTASAERRVCFSRGHGEADFTSFDDAGYGLIAREIRRAGYRVQGVAPNELAAAARGCHVVVIGGPQRRFAELELDGLTRYLRRGGRLLLLVGPVLDRGVTRYRKTGLEESLRRFGVALPENIVVDPLSIPGERALLTWGTRAGYNGGHALSRLLAGKLTIWRLAREVRPLSREQAWRAGCRACADARAFEASWLVRSSGQGWAESDLASLRGARPLRFDGAVDSRGPVPVAVAARVGAARLVVLGSERAVLNKRLTDADYSRDLVVNAVEWLAGADTRVAIGPRRPVHVRLSLDARQVSRVFLLSVVVLPALALAGALLTWWRRRR
ncbi:MAG: Gldg family protein, partial [Myxococcales bacterium]|nr:Gldg family protein [Myxococcales bacterium]